jgi:hypothetical protein
VFFEVHVFTGDLPIQAKWMDAESWLAAFGRKIPFHNRRLGFFQISVKEYPL